MTSLTLRSTVGQIDQRRTELSVGALEPWSSCDWPGKLVATIFLQGCPWNCLYCHNPDLIPSRRQGAIKWSSVVELLERRRGLLDGVVFSGGEATRQDLTAAIEQVRAYGFAVGLHTSGAYPRRLAKLVPLVDWVGFDVKALPENLATITGRPTAGEAMTQSLAILLASGVDHQVRTTWGPGVPTVQTRAELEAVLAWARSQGVAEPVGQAVRPDGARPEFIEAYSKAGPN